MNERDFSSSQAVTPAELGRLRWQVNGIAANDALVPDVLDTFDRTDRLALIAEQSTLAMLNALNWPGVVYRSSDLAARTGRSERLVDRTCAFGAGTYLCGTGGALYLDHWPFVTYGLQTQLFTTPTSDKPNL